MAIYAVMGKDLEWHTVEAHHCDFSEGLIRLRDEDMNEIAAYAPNDYEFIAYQKEYTLEEVLEQMAQA